ncbi:MAG: CCA tRNA nucleotidyltransferase [Rickettsiales bacterium]
MKIKNYWLLMPQTAKLIEAFSDKSNSFRFVGGCVRDCIIGKKVTDIDVATSLLPDEVIKLLGESEIKVIPTGIKHGTVTAVIDDKHFEITTLRKDVSCDGRHAEVEFSDSWQEDAKRRDFTINALYLSVDGDLFDYFDGAGDLQKGQIKFIGDARARIVEDYLRILRFFRFYTYYGSNKVDAEALKACAEYAEKIDSVSGERIRDEMIKILSSDKVFRTLELMQGSGVLYKVLGFNVRIEDNIERVNSDFRLRVALLIMSADVGLEKAFGILSRRWRLSNSTSQEIFTLITHVYDIKPDVDTAEQRKLIRKFSKEIFFLLVRLRKALDKDAYAKRYDDMIDFVRSWQIPVFPVGGDDLKELGMVEGKEIGIILNNLEKMWEDSDYQLTKEELIEGLGNRGS